MIKELARYLTTLIANDVGMSDYEREQIELALERGNFGDVYAFVRCKKPAQTKPPQKEPFKIGSITYSKTTEYE